MKMKQFIKMLRRQAPLWIIAALAGFSLQSCSDEDDFTAVDNGQPSAVPRIC